MNNESLIAFSSSGFSTLLLAAGRGYCSRDSARLARWLQRPFPNLGPSLRPVISHICGPDLFVPTTSKIHRFDLDVTSVCLGVVWRKVGLEDRFGEAWRPHFASSFVAPQHVAWQHAVAVTARCKTSHLPVGQHKHSAKMSNHRIKQCCRHESNRAVVERHKQKECGITHKHRQKRYLKRRHRKPQPFTNSAIPSRA